ncbi:MAG: ion transporter [Burkholderiaceae bacterium]
MTAPSPITTPASTAAAGPALPADAPAVRYGRPLGGWRLKLFTVIFEADTPAGRRFDLLLIWLILASVGVVMLDSFQALHARWGTLFTLLEWCFTLLFTAEYIARLACVRRPGRYARSGFGIVDVLAVLPTWAALFVPGLHALIDVRLLRLLRLFRILKLAAYVDEYGALARALLASRRKILVFLSFVLVIVIVLGTVMYVVEGPDNGFANVPVSVYWAISTMTTVGFGDITPKTGLGRFIASVMMLIGWGTLAVPTGIVSAELTALRMRGPDGSLPTTRTCQACLSEGHEATARFCRDCGAPLPRYAIGRTTGTG